MSVRSILTVGAAAAVLGWSSLAQPQTVAMQPAPSVPSPLPVLAPASPVATPQPVQAQPPTQVITTVPPIALVPTNEAVTRTQWRPDRTLLMTGLVLFTAPYIASVGIAATSSRVSDGNLAVPLIGPWLDLGGRRGCTGSTSCGGETGYEVLLGIDGILQTIGAFQIVGAFLFPETHSVTTFAMGTSMSLTIEPARVGPGAYGFAAVGHY